MDARHIIETAVGSLAVRVVGEGPSTAVLWPSLFMDGRSWERVLGALAQDRRLVVIDGPGHGGSGDPGRRYSQRDCVTGARQILDRLGVTGPVDWVGNAWGGHVGLRFAADHPSRCATLVTLGTPVAALSKAERRRTYPLLIVHGLIGPIELVLSGVTDVLLSSRTRADDPDAVDLVRDSLRQANRRMLRNAVRSISLGREDLTELLPRIAVPTLMVTGSDHAGFTPAQAQSAARLIPDARAVVVADAAYLVPLEAPAETSALIRTFWSDRATERGDVPDRTGANAGEPRLRPHAAPAGRGGLQARVDPVAVWRD